jgi:hypothetical protein
MYHGVFGAPATALAGDRSDERALVAARGRRSREDAEERQTGDARRLVRRIKVAE